MLSDEQLLLNAYHIIGQHGENNFISEGNFLTL